MLLLTALPQPVIDRADVLDSPSPLLMTNLGQRQD
jgi:hypothetical protein